jgi:hypothetical protein
MKRGSTSHKDYAPDITRLPAARQCRVIYPRVNVAPSIAVGEVLRWIGTPFVRPPLQAPLRGGRSRHHPITLTLPTAR